MREIFYIFIDHWQHIYIQENPKLKYFVGALCSFFQYTAFYSSKKKKKKENPKLNRKEYEVS